jgi:hypothetical protein
VSEAPLLDPAHFAALVAGAADEQLEAGLRVNREVILHGIFQSMGAQFDSAAAPDARAVLEWRIADGADSAEDAFHVTIAEGRCHAAPATDAPPDVVFRIGALDFLKLVTGNVSPPELFVFGRLAVEGDIVLAARSQSWFRIPRAPA